MPMKQNKERRRGDWILNRVVSVRRCRDGMTGPGLGSMNNPDLACPPVATWTASGELVMLKLPMITFRYYIKALSFTSRAACAKSPGVPRSRQ
jgi:hypothetical protein